MTVMFRVRLPDGLEGDVLHVQVGEYTVTAQSLTGPMEIRTTGHIALIQLDDGKLTSRALEDAAIIQRAPVAMPVPGPGRGR